jgi:hypothetical protein
VLYLLIFLILCNTISCKGCSDSKKGNGANPKLILSTNKDQFIGGHDCQVELTIKHKDLAINQSAKYGNYVLKVNLTQEGGIDQSMIEYEIFDTSGTSTKRQESAVNKKLSHLFRVDDAAVIASTQPVTKIFNIIPKGNPNKITITYQIFEISSSNSEKFLYDHTVTWMPLPSPKYKLAVEGIGKGNNTIIQAPDAISVSINKEEGSLKIGDLTDLKLEITRESGDGVLQGADANGHLEVPFLPTHIQGSSVKMALLVIPGTSLKTKFILSLKLNGVKIDAIKAVYKHAVVANWQFKLVGADPTTNIQTIDNGTKEIEISVSKLGEPLLFQGELNKLKLHIKRMVPGNAMLGNIQDGILELNDTNALILAPDKKSATKKLLINPGSDKKTSFELNLQVKTGTGLSTRQTLMWSNGAQLTLSVKYDVDHKTSTIIVKNTGKLPLLANQAKLSWDTNNPTVTIDGKHNHIQNLDQLQPGKDFTLVLQHVAFNDPVNVKSANLNVVLEWDQLENPIQKSCTLTTIPIDISLTKLNFDKTTSSIIYAVKNNGKEAIDLEMRCLNNNSAEGNTAIITNGLPTKLNLKKLGEVDTESGERELKIDFKGQDAADFKFELLFDGNPINFKYIDGLNEVEVNQQVVACEIRKVSLKFVDTTNADFPAQGIQLQGDNKKIEFKLEIDDSETKDIVPLHEIDKTSLKLIIRTTTGDAKIKYGTIGVTEIPGNDLDLDNINTFTIERNTANEASFNFQLMYDKQKNKAFGQELSVLPVSWKEDQYEINDLANTIHLPDMVAPPGSKELIENYLKGFTLKNLTNTIPADRITIELQSDNPEVKFIFNDLRGIGYRSDDSIIWEDLQIATLQQLLKTNQIPKNLSTEAMFLQWATDRNIKAENATVTIVVKKDEYVVAKSAPIHWRRNNLKFNVKIQQLYGKPVLDNVLVVDDVKVPVEGEFILENSGDDLRLQDLYVELEVNESRNVSLAGKTNNTNNIISGLKQLVASKYGTSITRWKTGQKFSIPFKLDIASAENIIKEMKLKLDVNLTTKFRYPFILLNNSKETGVEKLKEQIRKLKSDLNHFGEEIDTQFKDSASTSIDQGEEVFNEMYSGKEKLTLDLENIKQKIDIINLHIPNDIQSKIEVIVQIQRAYQELQTEIVTLNNNLFNQFKKLFDKYNQLSNKHINDYQQQFANYMQSNLRLRNATFKYTILSRFKSEVVDKYTSENISALINLFIEDLKKVDKILLDNQLEIEKILEDNVQSANYARNIKNKLEFKINNDTSNAISNTIKGAIADFITYTDEETRIASVSTKNIAGLGNGLVPATSKLLKEIINELSTINDIASFNGFIKTAQKSREAASNSIPHSTINKGNITKEAKFVGRLTYELIQISQRLTNKRQVVQQVQEEVIKLWQRIAELNEVNSSDYKTALNEQKSAEQKLKDYNQTP